jgi:hypothetical protein
MEPTVPKEWDRNQIYVGPEPKMLIYFYLIIWYLVDDRKQYVRYYLSNS